MFQQAWQLQLPVEHCMHLPALQGTAGDGRTPMTGQQLTVGGQGAQGPRHQARQIPGVQVVAKLADDNQLEGAVGPVLGQARAFPVRIQLFGKSIRKII